MDKRIQAKHIDTRAILLAIEAAGADRPSRWAFLRDLESFGPRKVVLAKCRSLMGRGLIDGCACGCRGDFSLTDEGIAWLGCTEHDDCRDLRGSGGRRRGGACRQHTHGPSGPLTGPKQA